VPTRSISTITRYDKIRNNGIVIRYRINLCGLFLIYVIIIPTIILNRITIPDFEAISKITTDIRLINVIRNILDPNIPDLSHISKMITQLAFIAR